ncbi:hypothetical protein N0V90_000860 [Kalmusia sp. IMI 367209]|nr:hypothetical protein N0V90_000860 [Kalmusia sp. IMI 367209]
MLGIGITPPEDIHLPMPSEPSIVWPPLDSRLLGPRHRCYHESNEVIQLLSIPERLFPDDAPITLDVAQILQANKRAVESLDRLIDCNCAKQRGHQAMLYASLISRALWWYREAAGDDVYTSLNTADPSGVPSPITSGTLTPPRSKFPERCVQINASSVTVGGFDIDDPQMQRAFRNQLIRHEVRKAGVLIDKFAALASHAEVQESDKVLFSTLGIWLKDDLAKAVASVEDPIHRLGEV